MNNNDILRRIRYTFDFNDAKMIEIFGHGGDVVNREQISNWMKPEEDELFQSLVDKQFAYFLNGFIIMNRGKKDDEIPKAEKSLTNNIIFRKLKIALNLKDEDIMELLDLANFRFSKHELSALFRKPDQGQYRPCKDQVLRNFLQGMQMKYRVKSEE